MLCSFRVTLLLYNNYRHCQLNSLHNNLEFDRKAKFFLAQKMRAIFSGFFEREAARRRRSHRNTQLRTKGLG